MLRLLKEAIQNIGFYWVSENQKKVKNLAKKVKFSLFLNLESVFNSKWLI